MLAALGHCELMKSTLMLEKRRNRLIPICCYMLSTIDIDGVINPNLTASSATDMSIYIG